MIGLTLALCVRGRGGEEVVLRARGQREQVKGLRAVARCVVAHEGLDLDLHPARPCRAPAATQERAGSRAAEVLPYSSLKAAKSPGRPATRWPSPPGHRRAAFLQGGGDALQHAASSAPGRRPRLCCPARPWPARRRGTGNRRPAPPWKTARAGRGSGRGCCSWCFLGTAGSGLRRRDLAVARAAWWAPSRQVTRAVDDHARGCLRRRASVGVGGGVVAPWRHRTPPGRRARRASACRGPPGRSCAPSGRSSSRRRSPAGTA